MKVMLIAPPLKVDKDMQELTKIPYPTGLAYIAANLEKNDFEVKILDTLVEGWDMRKTEGDSIIIGLPDEVIKAKIKSENPDVFGISAMFTTQSEQPHRIAKLIKFEKVN